MHRRDTIKMYRIFKVCATVAHRKSPSRFFWFDALSSPHHGKCVRTRAVRAHCHYAFYIGFICVPHFFFVLFSSRSWVSSYCDSHTKFYPYFFLFLSVTHSEHRFIFFGASFPRRECTSHDLECIASESTLPIYKFSVAHANTSARAVRLRCKFMTKWEKKKQKMNEYMGTYSVYYFINVVYLHAK